jgi:DNA polymerase III epsilon subunit-like protein
MRSHLEALFSVDVETSGNSPHTGSLLSIGACLVENPDEGLYLELRPAPDMPWDDSAEAVHGLPRARLERDGLDPLVAMEHFETWINGVAGTARPVFVGFNAPFDWMFVADYFWRYLGRNPFGVSALDLKSYYMGRDRVARWDETRRVDVDDRLGVDPDHNHQALDDARGQARLAQLLLGISPARP